jgi:hypothetical protein
MTEPAYISAPDHDDLYDDAPLPGPHSLIDEDAPSDLATLRADLAEKILEEVVLPVPARKGYESVHVADISATTMDGLRKRAKVKGRIDNVKLVGLVMANTNVAIRKDGRRLVDEEGEPLNFRSAEFLEIQGVSSAADAVRKFYGRDGDLDAASRALLRAAGWGEELETVEDEADPT